MVQVIKYRDGKSPDGDSLQPIIIAKLASSFDEVTPLIDSVFLLAAW